MRLLKKVLGGVRGRILVVILLLSGLTGIIVGTSSYYIARASIKNQVTDNISNIALDTQEILDDVWLTILHQQMDMVAGVAGRLYGGTLDPESIREGLSQALVQMPGFKRLSIFLNNGVLLASSDPAYNPGWVKDLEGLETGETVVVPFRLAGEPPDQEKVMTVAAPIVMGGQVVAGLAGDVPPEPLSDELGSKRIGSSGEIYVVNGEGRLLTLPPLAGEDAGLEILGEPLDTEGVRRVSGGQSGVAEYTNYAGKKVVGSYTWIPEDEWGLIVEEDAAQAFAEINTLRNSAILIVLGITLLALLAAALLSRRITKPLVALKTGAEKLGLGDLGYRLDLEGAEELESLVRSFNRMAGAIQSSQEMMEHNVQERTEELRALNEMITSLSRTMSPDQILQKALQLFMEFIGYETGWCYLAGDEGWRLLYRRCPVEQAGRLPEFISPGVGVLGRIAEEGEAVLRENIPGAEREELPFIEPEGSFAALPLRSPSRVLGLICLASTQPRHLSGDGRETLRAMADEVGIALENAMLYMQLRNQVDELEKANRELRSLDEMKSNFISAVTHELKQPLALISGYAQTMYDYYENLTYEEEMHCLRVIMERTQFLAALVEDFLDISMLEVGRIRLQREELDLAALARKAAEEHMAGSGGLRISVGFPPGFPRVVADARRMEQVFSNLLSNAVKFSQGRGEIRVSGSVKGSRVQVRVEDRGVGIDPSQLEKIFDRFYQADASTRRLYPGVGLGLFICRQLVEAHGGRIWAENRPEGGSVLIFEIPLAEEEGR